MFDAASPSSLLWDELPDLVAAQRGPVDAVNPVESPGQSSHSLRYRPSRHGRWIGWGVTAAVYALIGAGGMAIWTSMPVSVKEPAALTVIPLRPAEPSPPETEKPPRAKAPRPTSLPSPVIRPPIIPRPDFPVLLPIMPEQPQAEMQPQPEEVATILPPAQDTAAQDAPDSWEGRLLATLAKHRRYPRDAMMRGQGGTPIIHIVMQRDGRVRSTDLKRSSGYASLDREALSLPYRASPLPPPPDDRPGETLELIVPVEFQLH